LEWITEISRPGRGRLFSRLLRAWLEAQLWVQLGAAMGTFDGKSVNDRVADDAPPSVNQEET
jgi:hypothetical protein